MPIPISDFAGRVFNRAELQFDGRAAAGWGNGPASVKRTHAAP